jgi:hypothetical protein
LNLNGFDFIPGFLANHFLWLQKKAFIQYDYA